MTLVDACAASAAPVCPKVPDLWLLGRDAVPPDNCVLDFARNARSATQPCVLIIAPSRTKNDACLNLKRRDTTFDDALRESSLAKRSYFCNCELRPNRDATGHLSHASGCDVNSGDKRVSLIILRHYGAEGNGVNLLLDVNFAVLVNATDTCTPHLQN